MFKEDFPVAQMVKNLPAIKETRVQLLGWEGMFVFNVSVSHSVCLTLCDPMCGYNPPDFFVHGILQARILEWAAIHFSRISSWPRDWTQVSWAPGGFFTVWATREVFFFNMFLQLIVAYFYKKILNNFQLKE